MRGEKARPERSDKAVAPLSGKPPDLPADLR